MDYNNIKTQLCSMLEEMGIDSDIKDLFIEEYCSRICNTKKGISDWDRKICSSNVSSMENELYDFLCTIVDQSQIERSNRSIISPMELDIVIKNRGIAIEFNGNYWHSEGKGKNKLYHRNKSYSALDKGYFLVHIFGHQWGDQRKRTIIKNYLSSICGTGINLNWEEVELCMIDSSSAMSFHEKHNIKGKPSSVKMSAAIKHIESGELLCVMSLKTVPSNQNKYGCDYELCRLSCSDAYIDWQIKLFNYLVSSENNIKKIMTYRDISYNAKDMYEEIGFHYVKTSDPNYFYSKDYKTYISRQRAMVHNLPSLLGDKFDPSLSEVQNMKNCGYSRYFDCGNDVFVWERK